VKAESPVVCCRSHPMAVRPSTFADDGQRIWNITVMGSLWPLPSEASPIPRGTVIGKRVGVQPTDEAEHF
jgi:hypothetical protein